MMFCSLFKLVDDKIKQYAWIDFDYVLPASPQVINGAETSFRSELQECQNGGAVLINES